MSGHFVIIGNGAAGFCAAKALRAADGDATVSVFTEERHPFYLRRQLGDFLTGNLSQAEVIFQSRNAYRRERIDLFLMTPVVSLDPSAHELAFADGERTRYDRLLLATGTRALKPDVPGIDLEGVVTFDTLSEAVDVRRALPRMRHAVILGEGIVGLTLAQSLAGRGVRVTQLIPGDRFWPQMLDETTSALVEDALEQGGVRLERGAAPRAIIGAAGRVIGVETANGRALPAELVACGCRRQPATALARDAGLEVRRGIRVDVALRTSSPDVFAAGDVTEPAHLDDYGEEGAAFCWQRAWAQGGLAAAGMMDRASAPSLEAVRIRTTVFGHDLAVLGHGQAPESDRIRVVCQSDGPHVHWRMVFDDGLLVGAIVFGTGETVHELNRLVAERAPRHLVEQTLGSKAQGVEPPALPTTLARHCPICAAELVMHEGTRAGTLMVCSVCNTRLEIQWDGRQGWLDVARE
jgi:nitrite reductase (NADH) large subunit